MSMSIVQPSSADIKQIIEKTAAFVAKRGDAMEERILSQDKSSSKLSFLNPQDPLNPYYRQLVLKLREGSETAEKAVSSSSSSSTSSEQNKVTTTEQSGTEKERSTTEQNKATKSVPAQTQQIKPPTKDRFTIAPPNLSQYEIDLIKLTAMFTARNGDSFREGLLSREQRDPQYDFLKLNNINHGYYALLVEQYKTILLPPRGLSQTLRADYSSPQTVLRRLTDRATWENAQEKARKSAEEEAEAERIAYAQIDWQDFVVVETINFDDDNDELPAPKVADNDGTNKVVVNDDDDEYEKSGESKVDIEGKKRGGEGGEEEEERRKTEKKKKVRLTQVCPICHLEIPIEEISEHMRIELLDPNGKKQKELGIARAAQSALASGDEISANLAQFAKSRKDIFGLNDMQKDVLENANKTAETAIQSIPPLPPPPSSSSSSSSSLPTQSQIVESSMQVQSALPVQIPSELPQVPGMVAPQPPSSLLPMIPGMLGVMPPQAMASTVPPIPQHEGIDLEPPAKKPHVDKMAELMPEEVFLKENGGGSTTVEVTIVMPPASAADTGKRAEYKRLGETFSVSCTLSGTVGQVKNMVKDITEIPVNKQKLSIEGVGVLKDANTLAFYNVLSGKNSKMTLKFKERGGKKK